MRVLVIGSGGREHAIIRALSKEAAVRALFALPGNAGMTEAVCLQGDPMDNEAVIRTALSRRIDFCVVTPDDPLANGLVDALEGAGIPCFGPTKAAARLESSKVFAKRLMVEYGIPTARFEAFDRLEPARLYALNHPYPLVIKADGLAKGKGVVIARQEEEALSALQDLFMQREDSQGSRRVVIEEFLEGPEVSVLTLTDGKALIELPSAMDHKRALEGDLGPNTGGMGAIAPNPLYTEEIASQCRREIYLPTIRAMREKGIPFRGCLFFGLILTAQGPKALEYNARFGDPETQAVLSLLSGGLLEALLQCRDGGLCGENLRFMEGSSCCVVVASGGYPGHFAAGHPIETGPMEAELHYAGVERRQGRLVTAGGRVLSVTATAPALREAVEKACRAAQNVRFEGARFRRDIGLRALRAEETI